MKCSAIRFSSAVGVFDFSLCAVLIVGFMGKGSVSILLQIGVLNENIYNNIFEIRQARNKLVHEGKLISESKATLLFETVKELLMLASKMKIVLW